MVAISTAPTVTEKAPVPKRTLRHWLTGRRVFITLTLAILLYLVIVLPWYIAVQFHPEFKSKPTRPHPLFAAFVDAAYKHRTGHAAQPAEATATVA